MKRRKRTNANVPAKGRLRDIADRLWSKAVLADWDHLCEVCAHRKCEAHHLIPRQHEATRYELRNGICLCAHHHQFNAELSPHQNAAGWLLHLSVWHPELHRWYTETVQSGDHRRFKGTKTAEHYCDVIRGLKQYVEETDFERIVGIRFSNYLLDSATQKGGDDD